MGMVHADTSDSDALASAVEHFRMAWVRGQSDAAARRAATPSNKVPHDFCPGPVDRKSWVTSAPRVPGCWPNIWSTATYT